MALLLEIKLAWYIGVIGNSIFTVIFLCLAFIVMIHYKRKKKLVFLQGSLTLSLFALMMLSIVFLYMYQYFLRVDFDSTQTYLPTLMWFFNAAFTVSLLLTVMSYYEAWSSLNKSLIVLLALALFITGLNLNDYMVFWREGEILVYYTNKSYETLHTWFTIIAVLGAVFISLSSLLNTREQIITQVYEKEQPLDENQINKYHSSLLMCLSVGSLLLAFLIPRTDPGSITNPVNVKIFGYIVFSIFTFFFMGTLTQPVFIVNLMKNISKKNPIIGFPSLALSKNKNNEIFYIFVSTLCISLCMFLALPGLQTIVPINLVADEEVKAGRALFLFELFGLKWYIHVIGAIVPIIISIVLIVFNIWKNDSKRSYLLNLLVLSGLGITFSWILNILFNLAKFDEHVGLQPFYYQFYVLPILFIFGVILVTQTCWSDFKLKIRSKSFLNSLLFQPISPTFVYISTVIATLTTDLFFLEPITKKLLIGGAGIVDGIFYIPILSTLIYTSCLSLIIYFISFVGKKKTIERENS